MASYDQAQFARDVLAAIGAPATAGNLAFLSAWMHQEGTTAAFNPLATTLSMPGAGNFNSVGVKNYTSYAQGVAATAQTIKNYSGILTDLLNGSYSGGQIAQRNAAHDLSIWSTGKPNVNPGYGNAIAGNAGGASFTSVTNSTGGGSSVAATSTSSTPSPLDDPATYARMVAGFGAWALDDPELGPILRQAAANKWDAQNLKAALFNTTYYKTTSDARAAWDRLQAQDPAEANKQYWQQLAKIARVASSLTGPSSSGAWQIPQARLVQITADSLREGWTDQQLQYALAAELQYDPKATLGGDIASEISTIKKFSADYGVPITDEAAFQWGQQALEGKTDQPGIESYFKTQAKSMYPGAAAAIDSGLTLRAYADPYFQKAGQILGIDPQTMNLTDSKWQRLLQVKDPTSGALMTPTIYDTEHTIKSDPIYNYRNSQDAMDQVASLGQYLLQSMGKVV